MDLGLGHDLKSNRILSNTVLDTIWIRPLTLFAKSGDPQMLFKAFIAYYSEKRKNKKKKEKKKTTTWRASKSNNARLAVLKMVLFDYIYITRWLCSFSSSLLSRMS